MAQVIDKVQPEHGVGIVFWNAERRTRVLSAVLAEAALRRAVRLIPFQLLREQLDDGKRHHPTLITRPEFVRVDSDHHDHAH